MHGQQNVKKCPKHVEFYSKNKFEKLVYTIGFIIRIYHVARSPECQIQKVKSLATVYLCNVRQQSAQFYN